MNDSHGIAEAALTVERNAVCLVQALGSSVHCLPLAEQVGAQPPQQ